MNREQLDRFYVELTNPDELGIGDSRLRGLFDQAISAAEAIALLRELNDALAIPGWLQPRVGAVLDRAEEKR